MNNKIIYLTVRVEMSHDADIEEVVSECDYNFFHSKIAETEIVEVNDELLCK